MTWNPAFSLQLADTWQYSPAIAGELFRVSYFTASFDYGRMYLCQVETGDPLLHFGLTRFYPKAERDLFQFIKPECFELRSIGVKGDYFSISPMVLFFDVWV